MVMFVDGSLLCFILRAFSTCLFITNMTCFWHLWTRRKVKACGGESGPRAPLDHVKRKKQEMVTQALGCQSCGGVVFSEGEQDIKACVLFPRSQAVLGVCPGTEVVYVLSMWKIHTYWTSGPKCRKYSKYTPLQPPSPHPPGLPKQPEACNSSK